MKPPLDTFSERINNGEAAESVLKDVRAQYTTIQCLNVKLSLIRSRCHPTAEYTKAVVGAVAKVDERTKVRVQALAANGQRLNAADTSEVCEIMKSLPPRLSENARKLRLTRTEMRECKRVQQKQVVEKNRVRVVVPGRVLLAHARAVVNDPETCRGGIPELTLSLMLLTGRRECELLNGRSTFVPNTLHSLVFEGQAKKRDEGVEVRDRRLIPCLCSSETLCRCVDVLRARQRHAVLSNEQTSRRYQSSLSRHMRVISPWKETHTHVHSLRGIYTSMTHALFDWETHTNAFVSMCILGHTSLTESLVYTTFDIGREFYEEPPLGVGHLTPPAE